MYKYLLTKQLDEPSDLMVLLKNLCKQFNY